MSMTRYPNLQNGIGSIRHIFKIHPGRDSRVTPMGEKGGRLGEIPSAFLCESMA